MSDDKSDLTRIEDLGEFIHEANQEVDEALSSSNSTGEQTQLDDLESIEETESSFSTEDNFEDNSEDSGDLQDIQALEEDEANLSEASSYNFDDNLETSDDNGEHSAADLDQENDDSESFQEEDFSSEEQHTEFLGDDNNENFENTGIGEEENNEEDFFSEDLLPNEDDLGNEEEDLGANENDFEQENIDFSTEEASENQNEENTESASFEAFEEPATNDEDHNSDESFDEDLSSDFESSDLQETEANFDAPGQEDTNENFDSSNIDEENQDAQSLGQAEDHAVSDDLLANSDSKPDDTSIQENNIEKSDPTTETIDEKLNPTVTTSTDEPQIAPSNSGTHLNNPKLSETQRIKAENIQAAKSEFKKSMGPVIRRPSPLRELNKFHTSTLSGAVEVGGNPPFSILLDKLKYKDEIREIIKELKNYGIITEDNEAVYKNALITKRLLVPQLSENLAIILANKFKHLHLDITFGLSEEIFQSEEDSIDDTSRGIANKFQLLKHSRKNVPISSTDEILFFTSSLPSNFELIRQVGLIHVSRKLLIDGLDDKKTQEESLIDFLTDQMKDKAKLNKINAIVETKIKKEFIPDRGLTFMQVSIYGIGAIIKEQFN